MFLASSLHLIDSAQLRQRERGMQFVHFSICTAKISAISLETEIEPFADCFNSVEWGKNHTSLADSECLCCVK